MPRGHCPRSHSVYATMNDSCEVNSTMHLASRDSPVAIPWSEISSLDHLSDDHELA
jgi:hypothetical protein